MKGAWFVRIGALFFVAICLCITHIFVSFEAKQNISALAMKNTEASFVFLACLLLYLYAKQLT